MMEFLFKYDVIHTLKVPLTRFVFIVYFDVLLRNLFNFGIQWLPTTSQNIEVLEVVFYCICEADLTEYGTARLDHFSPATTGNIGGQ